jgi:DNA-binding response OmpR family regulator
VELAKEWQRLTCHAAPVVHAWTMRVLVVEDDESIAAPLLEALERAGFEMAWAATGERALAMAGDADLVLLDLGLPDMDGSDVCRRLRETSSTPVIVVTARGDESDRVLGLELGADDYVVKPFGTRELIARIRAVARRSGPAQEIAGPQRIGELEIDRRTRRVTVAGREIALTPKEFDLLALLGDDAGAVVSRQEIMDEVWDPHWYGPTKTLDVHVASVRKKLGDPGWIETVRSVGFRLRSQP